MLLLKKLLSFVFNKKTFNLVMSFLMIVSLAYVTIETIDPEPAEASSAFACTDGSSRGVIYRMVYELSLIHI